MQTWKFSIKPESQVGFDPFEKCKELGIVGVGWSRGYEDEQPRDYEHAKEMIKKVWGTERIKEIEKLFFKIKPGDHLWMHKDGHYYLCVAGSKRYLGREICSDFRSYDLGHAIEVKWIKVPDELVSGSIQRSVIVRRMIQKINLRAIEKRLSQYLEENLEKVPNWIPDIDNDNVKKCIKTIEPTELFSLMSPDDVEDVVSAKLQTEGWILLKSTCFRSKPKFEFSMTNKSGKIGLVQVKSGNWPDTLVPSQYSEYLTGKNEVFLFTTNPNPYPGDCPNGINCIAKEEVIQWMKVNCNILSPTLRIKLSIK